jgi:acetyl esterase/lipase
VPFHPQVVSMMKKRKAMGARPTSEFDAVEARKVSVANSKPFKRAPDPVKKKQDSKIKGPRGPIPIRVYTPKGRGPFPIVVYFHGGGWVVGSIDSLDEATSKLANSAKAVVVSVDYRLAPEHKFPAAPEDCYAVALWASSHAEEIDGDPGRLVVAGDSAGGNLAAAVCLMAREKGGPKIALQLLVYPLVDFTRDMGKFSNEEYGPTPADCLWYKKNYFQSVSDTAHPLASPLLAELGSLPPAAIVTAQYDTFTEQANEYARKLSDAGVNVSRKEFRGVTHGFWGLPGYFDLGGAAVEWGGLQVRKLRRP